MNNTLQLYFIKKNYKAITFKIEHIPETFKTQKSTGLQEHMINRNKI